MSCGCKPVVPFKPDLSDYGKAFDRPSRGELNKRRDAGLGFLSGMGASTPYAPMAPMAPMAPVAPMAPGARRGRRFFLQSLPPPRLPVRVPLRRRYGAFGGLGASALISTIAPKAIGIAAGTAVSSLIGTAAGTAGAIAFGAAAGSVVPVIGTVVGAAIGFLSQKLFGHANYAQVAASVSMQMQLAEAYKQVAGQYPGRVYGVQELHIIWWGLMHEGYFPKNPASAGWAPSSTCNVTACIQGQRDGSGNCPGCGGNQRWVDDLFIDGIMTQLMGFGPRSLNVIKSKGLNNPVQVTDQLYVPAWSGADLGSAGIKWASPASSKSPALIRQLVIDTYDAVMAAQNSNLPIFYGALPNQPTAATVAPTPTATAQPVVVMPVTQAQPVSAIATTSTPAAAIVSPPTAMPLPTNVAAGYTPTSLTTAAGATVYAGPGGQGYYTYTNGQMLPYVPTTNASQATPVVASALPVPALSPSTTTGTITPDQVTALIQMMQSQGASQSQQLTAALQSLQQSGVALTPQVQSQVAAQVQSAPTSSMGPMLAIGGAALVVLMLVMRK
jgi:hypothetical protein